MSLALTLVALLCTGGHHGHHGGHSSSSGATFEPGWLLDDAGKAWVAVELLSRADLELEVNTLHARWPGMGGVAALITAGIVLGVVGVGFTIAGIVQTLVTGMVTWVLGVGLGALGTGVLLIILGAIDFLAVFDQRNRYDYRIKQLEQRLDQLEKVGRAPSPSQGLMLTRF